LKAATLSEKKPTKKKQAAPGLEGAGPMDVGLLQSLVKLMQANDLNMIELRDGAKRVVLQRGAVGGPTVIGGHAPVHVAAAPPSKSGNGGSEEPPEKFLEIKSPMVGTFYSAPSPDAKPFVTVGTSVAEETDVCVIEAMKVFNNVKAECQGTIAKILVTNGQAVEFNQVLFLVKP
jgi:acetyl-CoA carboxylase biotin carboxyl carrier protein